MKTNRLYRVSRAVAVFLAGAFVMACGENNPIPDANPEITVDASSLDVFTSGIRVEAEPPGGVFTKDVLFSSTDKWAASVSDTGAGWISIQPSSGAAGKATMTVKVVNNDSDAERQAKVTVMCASVSKSFLVVQDGKGASEPVIQLDGTEYNFHSITVGNTVQVNVKVTNTGSGTLRYTVGRSDSDGSSTSFTLAGTNAEHTLAAGKSDSFSIQFSPQNAVGEEVSRFIVRSNAVNGDQAFVVKGYSVEYSQNVKIVSREEESGMKVLSFEEDGTVLIEADESCAPKVGDILCSGITDEAPYGFFGKVAEVTAVSTKSLEKKVFVVKLVAVELDAIFDAHYKYTHHVKLQEIQIDAVYDEEGHSLEYEKDDETGGWTIINFPVKVGAVTVTPKVTLTPMALSFTFEAEHKKLKEFGVDSDWVLDTELKVKVEKKGAAEWEKLLPTVVLKPITVNVMGAPLEFTPIISFKLSTSIEAGVSISFVPYRSSVDIYAGIHYNYDEGYFHPGGDHDDFIDYDPSDFKDNQVHLDMDCDLELKGAVKAGASASFSIGLFGCNYVDRKYDGPTSKTKIFKALKDFLAAEFVFDLTGALEGKFAISDFISGAPGDYVEKQDFRDPCSFKVSSSPYFQFFAIGIKPKIELGEIIWDKNENLRSLVAADYTDLELSLSGNYLELSANKYLPLFGYRLFPELEYGFTYKKVNEPTFHDINVRPNYLDADGNDYIAPIDKYKIQGRLPLNQLENGAKYELYPYNLVSWMGTTYKIFRKGKRFTYKDNGIATDYLDDVPGENL